MSTILGCLKLPEKLRKEVYSHQGNNLKIKIEGGNIVIIESKPARKKYPPKETLSSMIGVNKDSNLYESADEVDKYIKRIRNEWN